MKKILILIALFCFFLCSRTFASGTLFLDAPESFAVGQKVPVILYLDTGGVSINSIDVTLTLSDSEFQLVGYQDYKGLIKFWITPPKQEGNTIYFVGGIPGGVSEVTEGITTKERIPLVVLLFETKEPGQKIISIENSVILQNDGEGTTFDHTRSGIRMTGVGNFIAGKEEKEDPFTESTDITAPVFEQISLIPSSLLSKNPILVTFSAADEGSGIATYDAYIGGKKVRQVESPLVVNKKIFSYTVLVEAYDLYGNKQTASVSVPGILSGDWYIWGLVLLLITGVSFYIVRVTYGKK
jgi:hypothetical protein